MNDEQDTGSVWVRNVSWPDHVATEHARQAREAIAGSSELHLRLRHRLPPVEALRMRVSHVVPLRAALAALYGYGHQAFGLYIEAARVFGSAQPTEAPDRPNTLQAERLDHGPELCGSRESSPPPSPIQLALPGLDGSVGRSVLPSGYRLTIGSGQVLARGTWAEVIRVAEATLDGWSPRETAYLRMTDARWGTVVREWRFIGRQWHLVSGHGDR